MSSALWVLACSAFGEHEKTSFESWHIRAAVLIPGASFPFPCNGRRGVRFQSRQAARTPLLVQAERGAAFPLPRRSPLWLNKARTRRPPPQAPRWPSPCVSRRPDIRDGSGCVIRVLAGAPSPRQTCPAPRCRLSQWGRQGWRGRPAAEGREGRAHTPVASASAHSSCPPSAIFRAISWHADLYFWAFCHSDKEKKRDEKNELGSSAEPKQQT